MLEKSENQAGCEFRYVSLLGRSRCGRRTTYRMQITSSSASSWASPIAAYSCSSSARCQQSHIDPDQYFGPPPGYGLSLFSPAQEKSDVAWHSARKLDDAGSQPETMRPQIPFPPDTHVGCFAPQCCRSIGFSQELLSPALCRLVCLVHQTAPAFVRNVMVNQRCHLETLLLRGSTAIVLPMQASSRA